MAFTTRGDRQDAERTRRALNLAFPLIPGPHQGLAVEYGVWDTQHGYAIATLVVDKKGVVRFVHQPIAGVEDRPKVSQILKVLQTLKG